MRSKGMYMRLAVQNIKAHYRTYVPYLLASIGIAMMFFMIMNLAMDPALTMSSLGAMMGMGVGIIGIFSFVFILYINSFLIKQRMREFGLYNILGMEKKHIARVMLYETFITYAISMVLGIGLGVVFSKLMQLLLLRMIHYSGNLQLTFSAEAVFTTMILFAAVQLIAYAGTLAKIQLSNPIDLLKSSSKAESAPKVNWVLALAGVILIGIGYWMAITIENPAMASSLFLVAALFVILGTYCMFTAGSAAMLKILQKNKKYYYRKEHFINVSGMMYRMRQNAKGLASICILSCMAIVTISVSMGLYAGSEDILNMTFPQEIQVSAYAYTEDAVKTVDECIASVTEGKAENVTRFSSFSKYFVRNADGFAEPAENDNVALLKFYDIDDYNRLENQNIVLADNAVLVYDSAGYNASDITVNGHAFQVQNVLAEPADNLHDEMYDNFPSLEFIEIYVNDLFQAAEDIRISNEQFIYYTTGFDLDGTNEEKSAVTEQIRQELFVSDVMDGTAYCRLDKQQQYYADFGSIFFIGIFLGAIFLMATVLIIYYKQVSEGYEDRDRYRILQQVGMSKAEVRKTINSQVLTVFFLPLIAAMVHIAVAFPMLSRMVRVFRLYNIKLFMLCVLFTVGVFALIYALIYWITSRTYLHIVEQKSISEVRE